jgi:hypothetical protein
MFGQYDQTSIMQYSISAISSKNGTKLGNSVLSPGDIHGLNAMASAGYLESEFDKSDEAMIRVQSVDGEVDVSKGEFTHIKVPSNRFWWYSGDSREWTTAAPGTNLVTVYRKRNNRDINWYCFQDPSIRVPHWRFLGDEHDKCDATICKVFGADTISIAKGQTKVVRISDRNFQWRCGDSNESSVAPEGTTLIFATRASTGRDITWACYKEEA